MNPERASYTTWVYLVTSITLSVSRREWECMLLSNDNDDAKSDSCLITSKLLLNDNCDIYMINN